MKILFICTHNRCRSILSEAITNKLGQGVIDARSAGSQPAGEVHPLSLKYLAECGYDTTGLASQSWNAFEKFQADVVITVCDNAAAENCPVWFGDTVIMHWGLSDPSKVTGSDTAIREAFLACIAIIEVRARELVGIAKLSDSPETLRHALQKLGAQA